MDQDNCQGLESRVITLEKWMRSQQERDLTNAQTMGGFTEALSNLRDNIDTLNHSVETLSTKINVLEVQPANRYNKIIDCFISGVVALLVSMIFKGA